MTLPHAWDFRRRLPIPSQIGALGAECFGVLDH